MDVPGHEGEIPIPITSTYADAHAHVHTTLHDPPLHPSNSPSPPPTSAATTTLREDHHHLGASCNSKKGVVVVYRECLKNHAASMGGKALDGCGEFMPSGSEGTLEAFRCSACGCHRNFHRKEIAGGEYSYDLRHCHLHHLKGRKVVGHKGALFSASDAYGYNPASNSLILRPSPHQMVMPLGALHSSEWSEEMGGGGGALPSCAGMVKKRVRTKFTPEQKEKMLGFAEKVGWKFQKEEEGAVQQFCQEVGVKRRVLKVWMHNNKHNFAKKSPLQLE